MSIDDDGLAKLSLAAVTQHCREESERFFQRQNSDPRYCYELFRRAITEKLNRAWEMICGQYQALVQSWVERNPHFSRSGEEAMHFVNRAYEKMWSAITPDKFSQFPDLKSLLRYLQMCVSSVLIDHTRSKAKPIDDYRYLDDDDTRLALPDSEDELIDEEQNLLFWQFVQQRLNTEAELQLIYYRFVLDMKPREICKQLPETFATVDDVYSLCQTILARLRRDPDLRRFFDELK